MELNDDLVMEIITYLPLNLAFQCKLLSKNFNRQISDPKFFQKFSALIYSMDWKLNGEVHKISINSTTHYETRLPVLVSVLSSCKGLLLLEFKKFTTFCVFNPVTGAYQLIPYPGEDFKTIGIAGLLVDYPISDQYKLVTIGKLPPEEGYNFHVFSSGMWREVQLGMDISYLSVDKKPVYVHDSLHWLRYDGSILAFDMKKEQAIILDLPDIIVNHPDPMSSTVKPGFDTWLGVAQGLLTLIRIFNKSMAIAAYDYVSSSWRVSHTLPVFIKDMTRYPINNGFPIWIDGKHALFLVKPRLKQHQYLYEYDADINGYKRVKVLDKGYEIERQQCLFEPTLASVHTTLVDTVHDEHLSDIAATLYELKRFISLTGRVLKESEYESEEDQEWECEEDHDWEREHEEDQEWECEEDHDWEQGT